MLGVLLARARQGCRTAPFPVRSPALPVLFRGLPTIDRTACVDDCRRCADACPTDAIHLDAGAAEIELGRCLFCPECVRACPNGALSHSREHRLGATTRAALRNDGSGTPPTLDALSGELKQLLGRSLRLRQVSAGGCNGCEVEANALGNIIFDAGRFGIEFTASPRHADGLLVTGPVSANMRGALHATYEAVAEPKIVIATGACAISGGPYIGHPEASDGVDGQLPVDLYIPGCQPHPYTLLDALLRFLGRGGT